MEIKATNFKGLIIIKPSIFEDSRGLFFEFFNQKNIEKILPEISFVQDNVSKSKKNVIRGLHLQEPPFAQGKLVSVLKGSVIDVVVDIRKNSPTYGKYYSIELSDVNRLLFYIPVGFAHGFISLEDDTLFMYKCTNVYSRDSEICIKWDDPDINVNWNTENAILSEKDKNNCVCLKNYKSPF